MKKGITITQRFELENVTSVDNLTDAIFTYKENENEGSKDADYLLVKKMSREEVTFDEELKKFVIPLSQADTLKLTRIYYIEAQLIYTSGATNKWNIERKSLRPTLRTENVNGQSDGSEVEDIDMTIDDVFANGGGSSNYNDLTNKPRINNTELIGNKTDTDLGLATKTELNAKQDVITGGNGIDVSNDVVSVNNGTYLIFDSNGKLGVNAYGLGIGELRTYLTTNYHELGEPTPLVNKTYVDNLVSGRLKRLVVETLPTQDIDTNTIYMILKSVPSTNNIYDEYMYINGAWELIGSTEVDLSNYYTKTESDNKYQNKLTVGNGIDITNDNISVKLTTYNNILGFVNGELWASGNAITNDISFQSTMPYDSTIRQRLLSTYGDYNFQPLIDSTHKLSADLVDDTNSSNKFVTATEKSTWNDKQEQVVASSGLTLASDNKTLSVTTPLPTSAQADSGKFLVVDSNGNPIWKTIPRAEDNSF